MNTRRYVNKVLSYIDCTPKMRRRLKEDIIMSIENRMDGDHTADIVELMGDPKDMAIEMIDNNDLRLEPGFEYISSQELFGLPLIHITTSRRGVAKGIIAVGMRSIGLVSFGILSAGFISIGVLSLGLIMAMGSVVVSGLFSFGAIALSAYLSLGAVAIGKVAIGALSLGTIAVGDVAYGTVAIFRTSGSGETALKISESLPLIEPAIRTQLSNNVLVELLMSIIEVM